MSNGHSVNAAEDTELLRAKVNLETSRIAWKELQRFFAGGKVIVVEPGLDLVEVGVQISQDNMAQVQQWLTEGRIGKASDEQAQTWFEADAVLWAVVISPWVLVQTAVDQE